MLKPQKKRVAHRSFDQLIRAGKDARRQLEAECLGGLEVDDHLELGRLLNWEIGWLGTPEEPTTSAAMSLMVKDGLGSATECQLAIQLPTDFGPLASSLRL